MGYGSAMVSRSSDVTVLVVNERCLSDSWASCYVIHFLPRDAMRKRGLSSSSSFITPEGSKISHKNTKLHKITHKITHKYTHIYSKQ